MKRIGWLALLLTLSAHVVADEVPFNTRPSADLESLIPAPEAPTTEPVPMPPPPPPPPTETKATLELTDELIALLPEETDRTACTKASVWQAAGALNLTLSEDQLKDIESCTAKIQERLATLEGTLNALGVDDPGDPKKLWPKPTDVKKDLAAAAMVLDVEGDCAGFGNWSDPRAVRCAGLLRKETSEVLSTIEEHAERVVRGEAMITVAAAPSEAPIPAPPPLAPSQTPSVSTTPALPRSWESVVINALADQMVVQLKGVAAQKLLGVFGDALCRTHGQVDVASYFPETCALLLPGDPTTNVRLQITQLPAEFQRTLRNDLVTLLPAVLNMTKTGDRVSFYLVPLFNALRNPDMEPLDSLAAVQCPTITDQTKPFADDRICAIVTFAARMAVNHQAHGNAAEWVKAMSEDDAFKAWIRQFGIEQPEKAREELTTLHTSLTDALAAYKASDQEALAKARVAIGVTESLLAATIRLSNRPEAMEIQRLTRFLATTQRAHAALMRWGSVGRAVVRVAEDFRRGYDPLTLSERAANGTECIDVSDVGCVVKITGIAITAFKTVAEANKDKIASPDDALKLADEIAEALRKELETAITSQNETVRKVWDARVKTQLSTLTMQVTPPLIDIHRGVAESRRLAADTTITPAARDEALNKVYTNMVESTFEIWRISTGFSVPTADRERIHRLVSNARTCWLAAKERNYLTLAGTMYSLSLDLGIGKPLPQRAEQYRLLLTNLASAGNEQEFKTAVDTYLSQSASSIKKFDHPASITLTGLPGLAMAQLQNGGTNGALFAPVGVDFFVRNRVPLPFTRRNLPFSLGVFVSLLDLGNLVATKYDNDEDEPDVEQSTRFRDVFAPGAYIRVPIRQSGFSLGAGWSRVPVVTEGNDERDYASKISAFVAYDLSWFTFWRKD